MAQRNYSSTAAPTSLIGTGLGSSVSTDVTANVASVSGYPTPPFTAAIDRGTASEECVLVTASAGASAWTVQRGYDGTSVVAHANGARFEHCVAAVDFREANLHINAGSGVHGLTGNLVGDVDTQTLANKTLTAPVLDGIVPMLGSGGAPVGIRFVGAVQGANPTGGPYRVGDWAIDITSAMILVCTSPGSPGTWAPGLPANLVAAPGHVSPQIRFGTINMSTDASGYTVWNHNAGYVPGFLGVEPSSPTGGANIPLQHITFSPTTTQVTTRWLNQTGTPIASVAISFRWFVIYEATG